MQQEKLGRKCGERSCWTYARDALSLSRPSKLSSELLKPQKEIPSPFKLKSAVTEWNENNAVLESAKLSRINRSIAALCILSR